MERKKFGKRKTINPEFWKENMKIIQTKKEKKKL